MDESLRPSDPNTHGDDVSAECLLSAAELSLGGSECAAAGFFSDVPYGDTRLGGPLGAHLREAHLGGAFFRFDAGDELGALSSRDLWRARLSRVPHVFFYWLVAFYAVWAVRALWVYDAVDAHIGPLPRAIESHALSLFVWALPALFVARQVFGPRFASAIRLSLPGDKYRPAWRLWTGALVVSTVWFGGVLLFEHLTTQRHLSLQASSITRLVASLSLVPVAEEIVFRGLVLSVIERRLCIYRGNLLTSLLFVGIHLPYWIHAAAGRPGSIDEIALRALMLLALSLFLGALTIRTRSIWPAVVAHLVNNALVVLLA